MPETPLMANMSQLNKNYAYIADSTNENSFKKEYLQVDYLENYVERADKVISFLRKQAWVDKDKFVVMAHSQGTHVASELAVKNKNVTHLGLFGANVFGRIDQMIREERRRAETGKISWETAQKNMEYWYQLWAEANDPKAKETRPDLYSWKSFSKPTFEDLLKLDIPIYLTYGTRDITSDLCGLLPLIFISHGKNNLTLKRQIGLDHNFFEVDNDGIPDYSKPHWRQVVNEFIDWTLQGE